MPSRDLTDVTLVSEDAFWKMNMTMMKMLMMMKVGDDDGYLVMKVIQ